MKFLNQTAQTNWKLFGVVTIVAIILVGGGILLFKVAQAPPMEMRTVALCDLNADGQCDATDHVIFQQALGKKVGEVGYRLSADVNADGVVTVRDQQMLFPVTLPAPQSTSIVVTEADTGRRIVIPRGTDVTLRLSTRYVWTDPEVGGSAIRLTHVAYLVDPGFSEWHVDQLGEGESTLISVGTPNCTAGPTCPSTPVAFEVTLMFIGQDEIDTATWQTYRNDEFGFEVKYPGDWYAIWRGSALDITNELPGKTGIGGPNSVRIVIGVYDDPNFLAIDEALKDLMIGDTYEKDLVLYTKLADVTIGGIPAIRYEADRSAIPYLGSPIAEEVMFERSGSLYLVASIGFSESILLQNKEIMDQILSTFRFVP